MLRVIRQWKHSEYKTKRFGSVMDNLCIICKCRGVDIILLISVFQYILQEEAQSHGFDENLI